ncbi:hypothetical protein HA402_010540 [Bradysia odoriphaga]|nr:hypothetical protein HA402_010540 [Bradysia odoriphaga]
MAKTKNKKRPQADVLSSKKSIVKAKKNNPFEIHVNKEKHSIIGRQLKHDRGMPGVSRSKALKRRKDTLGQEYINKNKTNSFKDKRIGERTMSKEEAASARFVAERLNQFKAKEKRHSLFNLNEDEDVLLTHKGQTLEEIEQFDDPMSSDEDDEELGKLDSKFTDSAHFGGGRDEDGGGSNRKMAIEDLIAEQKRRKNEISKEKEEVSEMTQILDSNWRSLLPLMGKLSKDDDEVKPKPDEYDRALREMIFERRGEVSDKLKSDAEMLKEEKEKLEKLEKDRLKRMLGVTEEEKKPTHRSADDLDDGYYMQTAIMDNQVLAYNMNGDGKAEDTDDEDIDKFGQDKDAEKPVDAEGESKDSEDSEGDDEDDEGEDSEEASEEEDDEDNLSDLKDESDIEEEPIAEKKSAPKKVRQADEPKPIVMTETERKKMMEKASAELPYTFDLPDSYEELADLLKNRNAEYQNVIIERMIKSNHPKVIPENKERMNVLFAYLLQHINDVFFEPTPKSVSKCFMIIDRLCPHLYDLSHINPEQTTISFQGVIKEKQNDFRENEKAYPDLDVLVFFKLASTLYSTSDFRHHVCTPCFMFINQILTRCAVQSGTDIAKGLFLTVVVLEYTQLSKRFLPSVLNFLLGVLFLSVHKRPIEIQRIIPPFKSRGAASELLVLSENADVKSVSQQKMIATDLVQQDINDSFKVRALNTALNLTAEYLSLMSDNVGAQLLAEPFSDMLGKLQLNGYPAFVQQSADKVEQIVSKIMETKLTYLTPPNQKPKVLRLMEPLFDKVYDDKRSHKPGNKDTLVHKGMIRKVKSETRGAIREIRRDNAFLSKIKLKKRMESDAERKERVRQIFSEASLQQSELNALSRKKKHM